MTIHTDFPYHFGVDGMTARTTRADHVRDLLEQLLFTRPGERLTRPQFGCGLPDLLFGPLSPEIADAVRTTIAQAIQLYLARELTDVNVAVRIDGSALLIDVAYRLIATGDAGIASLQAEGLV
jgi:uncharacterized protein